MSRRDEPKTATAPYSYPYPMVSVAADIVCFTVHPDDGLQIALVRRGPGSGAYDGFWALPGGFLKAQDDRSVEDCARRELFEETRVEATHLELVGVYSAIDRDPRPERIISVAYLAVIPAHGLRLAPIVDTDVTAARWFSYDRIAQIELAFDHRAIIEQARAKLADQISFGIRDNGPPDLLFAFLPEKFTIAQAQQVTGDLKGIRPDRGNFRKWIERFLEPTGQAELTRTRPAPLYRREDNSDQTGETTAPFLPPALEQVRLLAARHELADIELILTPMTSAPDKTIEFVAKLIEDYADHPDFGLNITRVPDLRVTHKRTGRVLLRFVWQVRKKDFACTSLVEPAALAAADLDDLRPWNGKPHYSAFRLYGTAEDHNRVKLVLEAALSLFPR